MSQIVLHSLSLEGFGVYGRRATFRFHPGLNTLVSPNETGKSTLLSGLLATLFGLPERGDAEEWGTTRFRSWHFPQPFRGELLLQANGGWHRILRDFADHQVEWHIASSLADPHWQPFFRGEHSPSRRGDTVRQYQERLHELLGIDDLELFRLTYCLAQDIDERTADEASFRTREVPKGVQELLGGTGGRMDDVRAWLFDAFSEISLATAAAGLVRPGKRRASNQRTPGRLEQVSERMAQVRALLQAATGTVDQLQGSQEALEQIRRQREEQARLLAEDRRLLAAWDRWSAARAERRARHKQAVELEAALHQIGSAAALSRQQEDELRVSYPEYREEGFPFADRERALGQLIAVDEESARLRRQSEQLAHQIEARTREIAELDGEIQTRFAAFARQPHLLSSFRSWQQVAREIDEIEHDRASLEREIADSQEALQQISRWAALDPEGPRHGSAPHPAARLRGLAARVPILLSRAAEAERLGSELESARRRLEGPLGMIGTAPEELRREARACAERRQLLQARAAETARRALEADERLRELQDHRDALEERRRALAARLGDPGSPSPETALPPAWQALRATMAEKLARLREEADLLREAAAIPRLVRPSTARAILLPTLAALLVAGGLGFGAGTLLVTETAWRLLLAVLAGLVAAVLTAAIAFRRSSAPVLESLPAALAQLQTVRRSIEEIDRRLGTLRDLDGHSLEDLERQLQDYLAEAVRASSARGTRPAGDDVAALRAEAEGAASALAAFDARMAALGDDPARRIGEWTELTRRAAEIVARLEDLEPEVGPADWSGRPLAELPPVWGDLQRLAVVIAERIAVPARPAGPPATANGDGSQVAPALHTGGAIAEVLRQIAPGDWDTWITEATRFEQAHVRMTALLARREAFLAPDAGGRTRGERLRERAAELASECAPFTLDASVQDVGWAAQEFEKRRETREQSRVLLEKLSGDFAAAEEQWSAGDADAQRRRQELLDLLRAVNGDAPRALERLRAAADLRARLRRGVETEGQVVRSHGVARAEELRVKLEALREESALAARAVGEKEEQFPLLREIADADPDEIQRRHNELARRIEATGAEIQELDARREQRQHAAAEAQAEGRRAGNVAVLELELRALERERERLLLEREALGIAFTTVDQAERLFAQTHRQRLAEGATKYFRRIAAGPGRRIHLDESFAIHLHAEDGRRCALRQLSQGARDQLALSLRLTVAELLSQEKSAPLMLDDPFLAFDAERLAIMRETLAQIAADRQVLLLSHRAELSDWGPPLPIERASA